MSQPIRVLYILNAPNGGATQGILEYLQQVSRADILPYVLVPNQPTEARARLLDQVAIGWRVVPMAWWNQKVQLPPGRRLLVWGRSMLQTLFRGQTLFQIITCMRQWQIDLVHTGTVLNLEGALAARWLGKPHLWHIKETVGQQGRVKFWLPDRWLFPFIFWLSRYVLVMTEFIAEPFRPYDKQGKIRVLYDGVDLARFAPEATGQAIRQNLAVPDNGLLVAMCASLTATWKQHDLFIAMAAKLAPQLPEARFAFFGHVPAEPQSGFYRQGWDYYQRLRQQVSQAELGDQFVWGGFQPDIPAMMAALDILVHPCADEPFGRIAIEAMAAGKPVVGPTRGGISESVQADATGILVTPGDVDALAAATQTLAHDCQQRRRLSLAGRQRVIEKFAIADHVSRLNRIYREVVARQ